MRGLSASVFAACLLQPPPNTLSKYLLRRKNSSLEAADDPRQQSKPRSLSKINTWLTGILPLLVRSPCYGLACLCKLIAFCLLLFVTLLLSTCYPLSCWRPEPEEWSSLSLSTKVCCTSTSSEHFCSHCILPNRMPVCGRAEEELLLIRTKIVWVPYR